MTKIAGFAVTIEPGEQSGYVVECTELPGCCSQGDTVEEALENISEAIAGWLVVRLRRMAREIGPRQSVLERTVIQLPVVSYA